MQLALAENVQQRKGRFRLPPVVPPFNTRAYRIFSAIWLLALLLALIGPATGIYFRYSSPANNSQLMLGSRAGFAVSPKDATRIRFTVGPHAIAEGLHAGDHIVAVYGLKIPDVMPVTEQALAEHAEDPAYIAMGNLLYGTDNSEVPVTVRGTDGQVRDVVVKTGEEHIDDAANSLGIGAKFLGFIDVLHVIFYPFLLWAAWILHRRNARDAVSSILSLAVLLTIGAEQPSSTFLANIGVPRGLNVAVFDLGNICLLAGILLFPHGTLSWRVVLLIGCLPILMFLKGQAYQAFFVCLMILAVLMLLRCMRQTASTEMRQQIRWALFGFSGYALLRGISILADLLKWWTDSFGTQLLVEMVAGLSFALGVLILQLGLLVALLRYRLYDAEVVISRSANIALITFLIGGIFAGANEAVKVFVQSLYGNTASQTPGIFAAAVATVAVTPLYEKIQHWSEKRFQRNLYLLRDDLPECVKDLRETATLSELIEEVLVRIERGVRSIRTAAIVNGEVLHTRGITREEVEAWRSSTQAQDYVDVFANLDLNGEAVQATFRDMISHKVPMTSTIAIVEGLVPNRPPLEQRMLDALYGPARTAYLTARAVMSQPPGYGVPMPVFKKVMAYEVAFVKAGGLLAAGVDPTGIGGVLPGYGDQRNYELFLEAGFTPVQAVQILTGNGAKVLGAFDRFGSITAGKLADLVVIKGDPVAKPAEIRNVSIVFREGVGYDSPKLLESVKGVVGLR